MAFNRRRLIANRARREPSMRHEREPNAPLPFDGCYCEACENARTDAAGAGADQLFAFKESEPKP